MLWKFTGKCFIKNQLVGSTIGSCRIFSERISSPGHTAAVAKECDTPKKTGVGHLGKVKELTHVDITIQNYS